MYKALILKGNDWSGQEDSNLRPPGPKPGALPDCAMPRANAILASLSYYVNTHSPILHAI